jgi:nucleoside-diphosphate-sugar epimerase
VRILDSLQKPVHLKGKPGWIPREAEFVLGDVRDKRMWERCLDGVEAVYHFAAYQDYLPDFSTFFHVNAVGTALLYEVVVEKRMDLAKVIVASSQFVQGEGLYACPACRGQKSEVRSQKSEDRGRRSEIRGQKTDVGSADCAEKKCLTQRRKGAKNLRESADYADLRRFHEKDGIFAGVIRPEVQLKRGQWEMLCPECGEAGEWQWTPESHVAPPNAYAMAKYSQEMQALTFGKRYEIPSVALRYSIVQGPRQSFYNAYSGACRIFSLNYYFDKAPTLYEDGMQCRDFVNIHDVVRANILALEDERMDYGVFNVGGGKAYTVLEFAEVVREVSADYADLHRLKGNEGKLPEAEVPGLYRFGDTRNACSDISKIRALGWEPEMTPRDSVREYVEWLYEQDNVEDILEYAEKTMKEMDVVRSADYAD